MWGFCPDAGKYQFNFSLFLIFFVPIFHNAITKKSSEWTIPYNSLSNLLKSLAVLNLGNI